MIYVLSGGAGLKLKVVGGTAAPASPGENTVWVNTDTEISGYAFSSTQPENPAEGFVWFAIGAASNAAMNVDKKNTVMLYPLSCKQYINGAWVTKTAKTYQGGAWVEWTYYLFNISDQCTGVTGGWEAYANGIMSANDGYIGVQSNDSSVVAAVGTIKPIDLTNFKTLKGFACRLHNGGKELIGVTKTKEPIFTAYTAPAYNTSGVFSEFSVDVSGLSGEYYITLSTDAYGPHAYNRASQIWLE